MNATLSPWILANGAVIAPLLLDIAVKSVVLLSLALLLAAALGPLGSASRRHWVLLVGMGSLLALPLLSLLLPKWGVLPDTLDASTSVRRDGPILVAAWPNEPVGFETADVVGIDTATAMLPRPMAEKPAIEVGIIERVEPAQIEAPASSVDIKYPDARPVTAVWAAALVWVWIGGVSVFLARLAAAKWYLRRLAAGSALVRDGGLHNQLESLCRMLTIHSPVDLRISNVQLMPMMWGIVRASILLPSGCSSWTTERLRTVLLHELAHVKRHDPVAQLLVQLACALYWFNPLVWFAAWRVRVERERACDDLVLSNGIKASDYAEHLLAVATGFERPRPAQAAALAMAQRLQIEGRLLAILDGALSRSGLSRRAAMASVVAAATVLAPIAMMQAGSEQNRSEQAVAPSKDSDQTQNSADSKDSNADAFKAPTDDVTIAGRVVDENSRPVTGADVTALIWKEPRSTKSASDGRFTLNIPPKSLPGVALAAKFQSGSQQAFYRFSYEQKAAPKEPMTLVVHPARRIDATVVDGGDKAVAGAWLVATAGLEEVGKTTSDADGKATLLVPNEAPLLYVVAAKAEVGLDYFAYAEKDHPRSDPYQLAPDHRDPLRFVLNGAKPVRVRVVNAEDQPVGGATVYPWLFEKAKKGAGLNTSGFRDLFATTDDRGIARLTMIPADNTMKITLGVLADGYFAPERSTWDPQSGINELTATLLRLVKMRGSVELPDGRPGRDIEVALAGGGHHEDTFYGSVRTDSQGRFEALVHPDEYYLVLPIDKRWAAPAQHFIVRQQPREGIDFELQPTTRVHGRVTIGPNHAPWTDGYLQLYQKGGDYYKLPKDEQLPNPTDSNRAVYTLWARNTKTDTDGRFEFFAGPGNYYITGPDNIKAPTFEITNEREHEVNIHLPGPDRGEITGRVVFKDNPSRGAAEAQLTGRPTSNRSSFLGAITDNDGRFRTIGGLSGMQVHAVTSDGKQAGIVTLPEGETKLEIKVAPMASGRGRLLDQATGEPLAGRQIDYGVRVVFSDNPSLSSVHFGGSTKTDQRGEFIVKDIVVDWEYTISLVTDADGKGQPRSWHHVAKFTAKDAGVTQIGDIFYKAPARALTVEERISQAFSKKGSLGDRLRERQRDARLGHQRVLIIAADPQSDLCREFYELFYDDGNRDVGRQMANYLLFPFNTAAKDREAEKLSFAKLGFAWPAANDVTLAAISQDGKLVAALSCLDIADGGKLDPQRLCEFLGKHAPEMPDAEQLLAAALVQAKRENKRVLVQESGAYCAPCVLLSRFLDDQRDLIAKEYVYLSIDSRFKNGEDVIKRLGKEEGGIPWMVVLDSGGKPLINSNGPDGNIGFPSSAVGRKHFDKMLRTTARHLLPTDISSLVDSLARQER